MSIAHLRLLKAALVAAVAVWAAVSLLQNLLNWSATLDAVRATTSMVTFDAGPGSWQATSNPIAVWLGALFIGGGKLAAAVLCGVGAAGMWLNRTAQDASYAVSRRTALIGCGVALFMLFAGFIVIAEVWFGLWQSESLREPVLESAMRYAASIALIALFVASSED
ncbi:MAG: DUF2165 family protein [Pseudomonadota bacterium]